MADFNLPQTKKKEVLGFVVATGLDVNDFEWRQRASSVPHGHKFAVEALVHRPTGYEFEFGVDPKGSLFEYHRLKLTSEEFGRWTVPELQPDDG